MIERYQLRYFLAVVETGNFSRAAAQLNVTQPTLSVGISKLERGLGSKLFDRSNRRVQLTDAGSRLQAYARRIETDFHLAEQEAAGRGAARRIRLGIASTVPTALVSAVVDQHRLRSSGEQIEIVEGSARDTLGRLHRRRVDLALTVLPSARAGLAAEPLWSEGYAMALPLRHRLAGRDALLAEELAGEVMIVRRNCEALPEVSRYFIARGVRPAFSFRSANDDRVLAMVAAGLGSTVVPECFRDPGVALSRLVDFEATRQMGLLFGVGAVPDLGSAAEAVRTATALWRAG